MKATLVPGFMMAALLAVASLAAEPAKPYVPTRQYVVTNLVGWTVRVNRTLLAEEQELGSNAMALLVTKLREITNAIPPRACSKLQAIPIWLGLADGHAPCAEYHPSRAWLQENGFNPDKAKAVEIGNAKRFLSWSKSQPSMVLHELAHGYHQQVLGYNYEPIKTAYKAAVAKGQYESVKRNNGKTERAYALNNDQEYFAEVTEAFFGTNDFYPFTRQELKEHDPGIYSVLENVWMK
jgi:hypothetical protein